MDYTEFIKSFGAFFAIMNPFVNLPIFLALTTDFSIAQQRTLAIKVTLFSIVMCLILLVAGKNILDFFGLHVDQFRIAGGLVLASIAWSMLNGRNSTSHYGTPKEQDSIADLNSLAFYPLTFPMIVGPGTIATLIIYAGHYDKNISGFLGVGISVGTVILVLFMVLFFASFFGRVLTDTMRVIMTRLMGMILLAIAIEMVFAGVKTILPGLN